MAQRRYLSRLFPSLGHEGFLRRYWPNRPANFHGNPSRLGALMELGELGILVSLASRSRLQMKAILQRANEHTEVAIQPADLLGMYSVGATIGCADIDRWHGEVARWVKGLRTELGVPAPIGGCNLYLSPPGHGVAMHFDDHEVIVVQLSGRKLWRIAANTTIRHPLHNAGRALEGEVAYYADGPPPKRMPPGRRIAMAPGSVLFLPRGYWHQTDASERSVSLTFGFRSPCWLDVLQRHLRTEFLKIADWREGAWDLWKGEQCRKLASHKWGQLKEQLIMHLNRLSLDDLVPITKHSSSGNPRR